MKEKLNLEKIIKWNLIIYFGISAIELLITELTMNKPDDAYRGLFFAILSFFSIGLQVMANAILSVRSFILKNNEQGKFYLLSLLVVLLIGFPLCFTGLLLRR